MVQEQINEKLDFHCVGLEKDKNVLFPNVEVESGSKSPGTVGRALTPSLETGNAPEVTLPDVPSVLGGRRFSSSPGPDNTEPLDLLIKGEAHKKSPTEITAEMVEPIPETTVEEVMISNLEPIIDSLFEDDELFAQEFREDDLNRVLFIKKMGIFVEIKTKDYIPGVVCSPLFHCPRCEDHWAECGSVPANCQLPQQPTRGPAIHLASNRKRRFNDRNTKRRVGDIKERFIVSGGGTVLSQINGEDTDTTLGKDRKSRDYLLSNEEALEELSLDVIDSGTKTEAFRVLKADAQTLDEDSVKKVADALGFSQEQYDDFARVNLNKDRMDNEVESNDKTSLNSRLDLSMLDDNVVKDLPEIIREKLLSILRLQRHRVKRKKNKQMATSMNGSDSAQRNYTQSENISENVYIQGSDDEDAEYDLDLVGNGIRAPMKINRKRLESSGKQGRTQGTREGLGNMSQQETPGRRSLLVGGRLQDVSASERSSRVFSGLTSHSDEEEVLASRSPVGVLAYNELQNPRRAQKKNAGGKNRTDQPDTPFQRIGKHSMNVFGNSLSFYAFDDIDSDEEAWGQGKGFRVGSSRAARRDSHTSHMSEMSRGVSSSGHGTESRTSMLQKYGRTVRSAPAHKDASFSNLDDQASWSTNEVSVYDSQNDQSGSRSDRPRRFSRKKEKGDGVERPGNCYNSRGIYDIPVEANVTTYGSKAKLSQTHLSLIDASSPSLCSTISGTQQQRVPSAVIRRPLRSASAKEPYQRKKETIQVECMSQGLDHYPLQDHQKTSAQATEEGRELETLVILGCDSTPLVQAQETQTSPHKAPAKMPGEKVFKRTFKGKYKPIVSIEDLNVIHRLPVSSAFTYSFYELPNQHRVHNDSIKHAVGQIGRRKKKGTAHFRSRSAL